MSRHAPKIVREAPAWHGKVYRPMDESIDYFGSEEWMALRDLVRLRDRYRCQRCDKPEKRGKLYFTAHHIIPRDLGGPDALPNLILLCPDCHDFVECTDDLRTRAAIIASMPRTREYAPRDKPPAEGENDGRPAWHAWVYGGSKNPIHTET